jgi:hypothetical protein
MKHDHKFLLLMIIENLWKGTIIVMRKLCENSLQRKPDWLKP